jgi:hypothetical protein
MYTSGKASNPTLPVPVGIAVGVALDEPTRELRKGDARSGLSQRRRGRIEILWALIAKPLCAAGKAATICP